MTLIAIRSPPPIDMKAGRETENCRYPPAEFPPAPQGSPERQTARSPFSSLLGRRRPLVEIELMVRDHGAVVLRVPIRAHENVLEDVRANLREPLVPPVYQQDCLRIGGAELGRRTVANDLVTSLKPVLTIEAIHVSLGCFKQNVHVSLHCLPLRFSLVDVVQRLARALSRHALEGCVADCDRRRVPLQRNVK